MRLNDEFGDKKSGFSPVIITTIVAVMIFVLVLIIIIFQINKDEIQKSGANNNNVYENTVHESGYPETSDLITGSELVPSDLDFWDKYPTNKPKNESDIQNKQDDEQSKDNVIDESGEQEENDPSKDGKHTLVIDNNGEEEWVIISPYLPKHTYDFTNLVLQGGLMKYYEDSTLVSYVGVDISKYQDYVDFLKLKKAGIQFVMIRVGARGYGTGQLLIDEYFSDNIKRATDAGLDVGLYFSSCAITADEAVEEAQLVLDNIGEYNITYPIAFDMEFVSNDTSRIDVLTKAEKTDITKAFMEKIEEAGYKGIIYGNKEWLIKEIDMSKLTAYDVWLSQTNDIPDYPYRFSMWRYSTQAVVDGINGFTNINISFIDYTEK